MALLQFDTGQKVIQCTASEFDMLLLLRFLQCPQTRHFNPLTPTAAIWVQLQSILCQTGLSNKQSFVIFDIRAIWRSALSVRVPECQKLQMTA